MGKIISKVRHREFVAMLNRGASEREDSKAQMVREWPPYACDPGKIKLRTWRDYVRIPGLHKPSQSG